MWTRTRTRTKTAKTKDNKDKDKREQRRRQYPKTKTKDKKDRGKAQRKYKDKAQRQQRQGHTTTETMTRPKRQRQRQRHSPKTKTKAKDNKYEDKAIYSARKFSVASECVITTHSDADPSPGQKVTVADATDSIFHFYKREKMGSLVMTTDNVKTTDNDNIQINLPGIACR